MVRRRLPRVKPTPNTDPWRKVVKAGHVREGRGGLLGPDTERRTRWRELTLECGHVVERTVRYKPAERPQVGGTQCRPLDAVLPAPKKVRCEYCALEARQAKET